MEQRTRTRWVRLATAVLGMVIGYLLIALLWDTAVLGVDVRRRYVLLGFAVAVGGIYAFLRVGSARGRIPAGRLKELVAVGTAVMVTLAFVDAAYFVFSRLGEDGDSLEESRLRDPSYWTGEMIPRRYHPTAHSFRIHKPNVTVTYLAHGDLYYADLRRSPTLLRHVLRPRWVTYVIDRFGFRNRASVMPGRIVALGDSFTFGVSVDQDRTWVARLSERLAEPVYNLGVSGHSPLEEVMLLEYFLEEVPRARDLELVVWMLFEGNDLEDEYDVVDSEGEDAEPWLALRLADRVLELPGLVRSHSAPHILLKKALRTRVAQAAGPGGGADPYLVDGIRIGHPLYRSEVHGYKLFFPEYIRAAQRSESYVLNHPNRSHLDATFAKMRRMADDDGFEVVVTVAPSAERLHGAQFDGFPELSKEPYFANYLRSLAAQFGFSYIDLYASLRPIAETRLLYLSDDTHWNEDGHEHAAAAIFEWLSSRGGVPLMAARPDPSTP